jgi:hypothetical protein
MSREAHSLVGLLIGGSLTTEMYTEQVHLMFFTGATFAYGLALILGIPTIVFLRTQRWMQPWQFSFAAIMMAVIVWFLFLNSWPPPLEEFQDLAIFAVAAAFSGFILWRIGYRVEVSQDPND